jgi:uncharacterized protein
MIEKSEKNSAQKPYRVLSIDGGGIRGLYSAVLLQGLATQFAREQGLEADKEIDLGKQFDLIVGTSTGAILATALAAGVPLSTVIRIYQEKAKLIFQRPVPEGGGIKMLRWAVSTLFRAANDPQPLQDALDEVFKTETLGDLFARRKIGLCIPTVDVQAHKSWVFKPPITPRLQRDVAYRLADICMASAAAPLIFPLKKIVLANSPTDAAPRVNWFADGGLWANNPSVVALTEALTTADPDQQIQLVSVSTCPPFKGTEVDDDCCDRGLVAWSGGVKMVETALDAQAYAYDYITRTLAQKARQSVTYVRLSDPDVGAEDIPYLGLDNPSEETLNRLVKLAHRAVDLNRSEATSGSSPPKAVLKDVFANLQVIDEGVDA